ncbi:conserved hypothetical protein [metagenome]|uniref:Uncharacterized protein n=1 Tax=metagenome TaxID=256318 RepID=A0A2P2C5M3_9ZZZZ
MGSFSVLTLFSGRHLMHVRRLLALSLAVPLLLAGCSDEEKPTPKMPDSTSSSPSTEPTETETPEAESPEDFIRRWAALETDMENSGETSEYLKLSERCDSCRDLAETIEGYYRAGGSVRWGGWTIHAINAEPNSGTNAYSVDVSSAPTRYKESASGPTKRLEGGDSTHLLRLAKSGLSWVVVDKAELAR